MRWLICFAFASVVLVVVPRPASAQGRCFFFGTSTAPCPTTPLVWSRVTFGPATFVKPKPKAAITVTGGHGAHRVESGSFDWAPAPKTTAELDCISARPGDPTLDRNMVRIVPPTHDGLVRPVPPCARK